MPDKDKKKYSAPALEKGLAILELLSNTPGGLGLTQISDNLKRSKTEIFRMVAVLKENDYIEYFPKDRVYRLSLKLFRLTHSHAPIQHLNTVSFPLIQQLCTDTRLSCHMVVYSEGGGLIVSHQDYDGNTNRLTLPIGGRGPLINNCAGHVLLSFATYNGRERMLKAFQEKYPDVEVDLLEMRKVWERVKQQGYEAMDSPVLHGVYDIGYPVFNHIGQAIAVLMVSFLLTKDPRQNPDLDNLRRCMNDTAADISRRLGHSQEGEWALFCD